MYQIVIVLTSGERIYGSEFVSDKGQGVDQLNEICETLREESAHIALMTHDGPVGVFSRAISHVYLAHDGE